MLSNEELMKVRYKVIADYPEATFPVGTIIPCDAQSIKILTPNMIAFYNKFPNIFKPLQWWEERGDDFVKSIPYWKVVGNEFDVVRNGQILTAHDFKWWGFSKDDLQFFLPATLEEYTQYINLKK